MSSITDLEIFTRVADTSNMSAAGRELGLSPAVISKRISGLEDKLNARLFQRTTRRLSLTDQGYEFYQHITKALKEIKLAEELVQVSSGAPRGILKLSVSIAFGHLQLLPILPAFMDLYPDIQLEVHLSDEFVNIIGDKFDMAIRIGNLDDGSFITQKLVANRRVLCATPQYLQQYGEPMSLDDLKNHECLTSLAQPSWVLVNKEKTTTIRIQGRIKSNSSAFIYSTLKASKGIALRSIWEVSQDIKNKDLIVILPEYIGSPDTSINLVYPSLEFMPSKVKALTDFLTTKINEIPHWDQDLGI